MNKLVGLGRWRKGGGTAGRASVAGGDALAREQSRNLVALLATCALMYTAWDMVTPFVPLLVLELEGGDPRAAAAWSGVTVGVAPLLTAVAGPFWGAFADRFGGRAAMLRTILTSVGLVILTAYVMNIWQLLIVRALIGLLGGFFVLMHSLAAETAPRDRVGQTIGALQAIMMVCLAIIPPVSGFLVDRWGLRSNFLLAAGVMVVAFAVMWSLYRSPPKRTERDHGHAASKGRGSYWKTLANRDLALIAIVIFSAQFVERVFNALAPLLVVELEPSSDQIGFLTGLVLGLGAGASAVAALASGRLARRLPARTLLLGSLACGCLVLPLLAGSGTVWQLLALRVVLGLLAGGAITLAYAVVSTIVPADRLGASFSMFASCAMLGAAVGPLSLGPAAAVSLRLPLVAGAVAFAICLLLLLRSKAGSRESTEQRPNPDPSHAQARPQNPEPEAPSAGR